MTYGHSRIQPAGLCTAFIPGDRFDSGALGYDHGYGPGVLIMIGITVTSASFYRLTRKRHGRILAATERAGG